MGSKRPLLLLRRPGGVCKGSFIRTAVATAVAALVAVLPLEAPAQAATRPTWLSHATYLHAGHARVLKLARPGTARCKLVVTSPSGAARGWKYPAASGTTWFAFHANRRTRPGRWTFTAHCVRRGATKVLSARTSLHVLTGGHGRQFLVGKAGPAWQIHVPTGEQSAPTDLPAVGGRGGDPGDDYPYTNRAVYPSGPGHYDPWGEEYRQCTSFVAWALHSRNNFDMPFHADAGKWGGLAQQRGFKVDDIPAVGAVGWEAPTAKNPWGHVAWVAEVSGDRVRVEEYNEHYYNPETYSTRWVPKSAFQYIHFKDMTYTPPAGTTAPPPVTQPPSPTTHAETTGSVAHTWTNYASAGGVEGQSIAANQTVQIACKVSGFRVADGNTWWYQIASSPWNKQYYVSADAFYNNGSTSGSLSGTPFVDTHVPDCTSGSGGGSTGGGGGSTPSGTHAETTGSTTHTWTNYTNAGGTQGPSIAANQTVQIACKVTGFKVADGNTWWYRIASAPWSGSYYASADAFYNNGSTSGSLSGTPFVDNNVPTC